MLYIYIYIYDLGSSTSLELTQIHYFLWLTSIPEKTTILKDICTPLFIAALFTIARTWKQLACPLTDEWIKKMWYIIYNRLIHVKVPQNVSLDSH